MPSSITHTAARLFGRLRPHLPWLSLAVAVASALWMDRSPERAPLIATAAAGSWLLFASFVILSSRLRSLNDPRAQSLARKVRLGSLLLTQSLTQLSLFFAFPFYLHAATLPSRQLLHLGAMVLACACCAWDPLYARLAGHPSLLAVLQAFASFSALSCVLPLLGLSLEESHQLAALVTTLAVPLVARLAERGDDTEESALRRWTRDAAWALSVLALFFGGGLTCVPPAPLTLKSAALGSTLRGRELDDPRPRLRERPAQLICASAIAAPRGLEDALYHVWRHEDGPEERILLHVSGGRAEGFRTWSVKRNLGPHPEGLWTCTIETAAGQRLGTAEVRLE